MSPASGDFSGKLITPKNIACFHSINVPSEWGPYGKLNNATESFFVSIQLMSPASGDLVSNWIKADSGVSIQLMSPASGDANGYQDTASTSTYY